MRPFVVATKDVRVMIRDPRTLMMLVIYPMIIIAVLALAFGKSFTAGGEMTVTKFPVAIANLDGGRVSTEIVKEIKTNRQLAELLEIQSLVNRQLAVNAVHEKRVAAALVIPMGLTTAMNNPRISLRGNAAARLEVLADPARGLQASIFQSIVRGLAAQLSAHRIAPETAWQVFANTKTPGRVPSANWLTGLSNQLRSSQIAVTSSNTTSTQRISSFQYYGAGMAVMFLLFATMAAARSILEERDNNTLHRMLTTPANKLDIMGGKMIGIVFVGGLQLLVLIVFTRLAYGVSWGDSILGLVMIGLATVLAATGLAVMVAGVTRNATGMDVAQQLIVFVMSVLGGSFVPKFAMGAGLQAISGYTVNGMALEGFTKLMSGHGAGDILSPVLGLLIVAIVGLTVGAWRLRIA